MIYDLHTHSSQSDGTLTPANLIQCAIENHVDVLSITDHDTVDAYQYINPPDNIKIISGIEISSVWRKNSIHIVGLNINLASEALQTVIKYQKILRNTRAEKILQRLEKKLQVTLEIDDIKNTIDTDVIGRPHIAKYLVQQGLVKNDKIAFDKYLGNGKLGDIKQGWPEMQPVVNCILESGGIAVLAHPMKYSFTRTKLTECLADFKTAGGQAVEVISGKQTPNTTADMLKLCKKFELYASCGSDFHQPGQPWTALGKFGELPETAKPVWELF